MVVLDRCLVFLVGIRRGVVIYCCFLDWGFLLCIITLFLFFFLLLDVTASGMRGMILFRRAVRSLYHDSCPFLPDFPFSRMYSYQPTKYTSSVHTGATSA